MGFPMIQVFMIAARQVSKPVADAVLRYGKDHPGFRNKLLIPIGRGLVRLSTRLRMSRLGLGAPAPTVQISEAAALEQASDFVQQVVLFSYSLGVFTSYYFYTRLTTPDTVKAEEFETFKEEHIKIVEDLQKRLQKLEDFISTAGLSKVPPSSLSATAASIAENDTTSKHPKFSRVSSLPIDAAAEVVLKGERKFLVVRSGSSVGIEDAVAFNERGIPLVFRKKEQVLIPPRPGIIGCAERIVYNIIGRFSG